MDPTFDDDFAPLQSSDDPAAEFLANEREQLRGLEDDIPQIGGIIELKEPVSFADLIIRTLVRFYTTICSWQNWTVWPKISLRLTDRLIVTSVVIILSVFGLCTRTLIARFRNITMTSYHSKGFQYGTLFSQNSEHQQNPNSGITIINYNK